jgi:DNA-binding response OmpR family regulator
MKILVVEDEKELRESITTLLKEENYLVEAAGDFNSAQDKLDIHVYDCVLLDINLPGGNGLDLLRELKEVNKETGIIILSARGSLDDKVNGLDLGADDYLPKPFHMAELNARIKSLIRRKTLGGHHSIEISNLNIDVDQRTVSIDGEQITLNKKEFEILMYLATNKNRLVNKSAIAAHVWGDYIDEANSFDFIYSQIKNLRKKLKDANADVEIQAVYGVGYKLIVG